jgi:hypothetical protein
MRANDQMILDDLRYTFNGSQQVKVERLVLADMTGIWEWVEFDVFTMSDHGVKVCVQIEDWHEEHTRGLRGEEIPDRRYEQSWAPTRDELIGGRL